MTTSANKEGFLGTFYAVASGKNVEAKSGDLQVYDGVKLYPLLYGAFDESKLTASSAGAYNRNEFRHEMNTFPGNVALSQCYQKVPQGFPDFKSYWGMACYHYFLTPPRIGWIYVYREKQNRMEEYMVNADGDLIVVTSSGYDRKMQFILLSRSKDQNLWISFSQVRWSKQYIGDLQASASKRNVWMQLIDCQSLFKGTSQTDAINAASPVHIIFPPEPDYFLTSSAASDGECTRYNSYCKRMTARYTDAGMQEKQYKSGDFYFCLRDIQGIAGTVCQDLLLEHSKMKALIYSLQTGRKPDEILEEILLNDKPSNIPPQGMSSDDAEQIQAIHTLGVALYRSLFAPQTPADVVEIREESLDKTRLFKVLGREERKSQNDRIHVYREVFATILESKVLQDSFVPYIQNTTYYNFKGKEVVGLYYRTLSIFQSPTEAYIESGMNKGTIDKFEYVLQNCYEEKNYAGQLLDKETEFMDAEKELAEILFLPGENETVDPNLSAAGITLVITMDSVMDTFCKYVFRVKKVEVQLKFLKKITVGGEDLIVLMKKMEMREWAKKLDVEWAFKVHSTGPNPGKRIRIKFEEGMLDQSKGTIKLPLRKLSGTTTENAVRKFLNHPFYQHLMLKLAFIDLLMIDYSKESMYISCKLISSTSTLGLLLIRNVDEQQIGRYMGIKISLGKLRIGLGWIGNIALFWENLNDIYTRIGKRDYDAMAAYFVSLAAWIVLAVAKFHWLGKIGVGIMAVCAGITGESWTDSPFKSYLKCTVFTKYPSISLAGKPIDMLRQLANLKTRKVLAGNSSYIDQYRMVDEFCFVYKNEFKVEAFPIYRCGQEGITQLRPTTGVEKVMVVCSIPQVFREMNFWREVTCELLFSQGNEREKVAASSTKISNPRWDYERQKEQIKDRALTCIKSNYTEDGFMFFIFDASDLEAGRSLFFQEGSKLVFRLFDTGHPKPYCFAFEFSTGRCNLIQTTPETEKTFEKDCENNFTELFFSSSLKYEARKFPQQKSIEEVMKCKKVL